MQTPYHESAPLGRSFRHSVKSLGLRVVPARAPQRVEQSSVTDDEGGISDLLIRGLVNRLPTPDSTWSLDSRAKWLRTAASIFGLVYRADGSERGEISIDLASEQVVAEPKTQPMAARFGTDAKDEPAPRKFPPL